MKKLEMIINLRKLWRIWAKALGEKASDNADAVAIVRTLLITQAVITNVLISINIIIKWLWDK
jgi:hypothetical protein